MVEPSLSLEERIAQLVWPRLGSNMHPPVSAEADAERVADLLTRCPVGGLIVFRGEWPESRRTLAQLQEASTVPLLVGSDVERGMGQQFRGLTVFSHAQAFDALEEDAEEAVDQFTRITAREAQAIGVHIAFAPVADVDLYAQNPIIATRAFSQNPRRAAALVRAYVRAAEAEGLLTTAKHFPGHGRTQADSHDELPEVQASHTELEQADLVPFRAAIEAGVSCIMTAHVAFPALHDASTPATRSRPILTGLLRDELGFDGLVVSDSLLMAGAASEAQSIGQQAAQLIKAGVDVLLDPDDPEAMVRGLYEAVRTGELDRERVDQACERVLALKRRVGLFEEGAAVPGDLDVEGHQAHAKELARRSIWANEAFEGREAPAFPQTILYVPTQSATYPTAAPLQSALDERGITARIVFAPWDEESFDHLDQDLQEEGPLLIVLAGGPAAWRASSLTQAQHHLVASLLQSRECTIAVLGPHALLDGTLSQEPVLCTYSDVPAAQHAVIERVFAE